MITTQGQDRSDSKTLRSGQQGELDLTNLQPPRQEEVAVEVQVEVEVEAAKTTADVERPKIPSDCEENPSHFAPENPTNRELAKERWYTKAAWASIGIGYCAGLASIAPVHSEAVAPSVTSGILRDVVLSYWALRNSELRRFILEGSVLPSPGHTDKLVCSLLGLAAAYSFLAALSSSTYATLLLTQHDYAGAAIIGSSALGSLHVGCGWVRRIRFFSSINSQ
jgi:hypothetical protein